MPKRLTILTKTIILIPLYQIFSGNIEILTMILFKHIKSTLSMLIILFFPARILAQENYFSQTGNINIIGVYNDTIIVAQSKELLAIIDYETAHIILKLNPNTLNTNNDSLNNKFNSNTQNHIIVFHGKLGIDHIYTGDHPAQYFNIAGELSMNNITKHINGTGNLKHIFLEGSYAACFLSLNFDIDLNDFEIRNPNTRHQDNTIKVEIYKTILEKDKY